MGRRGSSPTLKSDQPGLARIEVGEIKYGLLPKELERICNKASSDEAERKLYRLVEITVYTVHFLPLSAERLLSSGQQPRRASTDDETPPLVDTGL